MTVGERIQYHRKKQNLSQEELGQKLLVSRQTVSLWETDQTLPTVDNLRLLRDIFGISIDELLGVEPASVPDEPTPLESYTFRHTREHLDEKLKSQRRSLLARFGAFLLVIAIFFISAAQTEEYRVICLCLGAFAAVCACRYIAVFWQLRKKHDSDLNRMLDNTYTYNLFENELHIRIQRDGECLENLHIPYDALAKVGRTECYYEIYNRGRMYFVPRSLFETGDPALRSRFETLLETKRSNKKGVPPEGKWWIISTVLVALSILALIFENIMFDWIYEASFEGLLELHRRTWVYFVLSAIPLASVGVGIYLRCKGVRSLKNIIIGVIVALILIVSGTIQYIVSKNTLEQFEEPFLSLEKYLAVDLPEVERYSYDSVRSSHNDAVRLIKIAYFDAETCAEFEKDILQDRRWLTEFSDKLSWYSDGVEQMLSYDYILLYDLSTGEFNPVTKTSSGKYHFLVVCYELETHCMQICDIYLPADKLFVTESQ
ncbi:MAG: helix-turn-helix transcriptional regulator [Clostridia bacterium]|nr:helix-turn-helix transcriptional regulator [Clostridia bacterium]